MANLNFQQPPRSIASASLASRSASGFGGSSLSGHVTPTSGMFPPGGANYQSQQPQLSPNRNAQLSVGGGGGPPQISGGGRANIFSQRSFADRRAMQGLSAGPMSNMGSFIQTSRGGYNSGSGVGGGSALNNFHSVFGGSTGDTATPPLLDLSEFPSLTNARGQNDQSLPQSNPLQPPGSKPYDSVDNTNWRNEPPNSLNDQQQPTVPFSSIADIHSSVHYDGMVPIPLYLGNHKNNRISSVAQGSNYRHAAVGMVKQPTSEQSEFQMSNEDFPALPGTQITDGTTTASGLSGSIDGTEKGTIGAASVGMDLQADTSASNDKSAKRGVQTSPDGKVTNIPASMVNNQFGMVGLLTFIRAAESDPNLVTLAMGQDLTGLGLNLNSQENLHPTFAGPFADQPCRAQDIEYNVPPEYLVNVSIRDKLSSMTLKKYKDDLLFFLFYTNVGDVMQLMAAAELHSREWRYHIEEKVWITRIPGITHYEKNGTKERGTFYYFDAQNWRRVPKDFQIDADKLDKCPNLGTLSSLNGQPV